MFLGWLMAGKWVTGATSTGDEHRSLPPGTQVSEGHKRQTPWPRGHWSSTPWAPRLGRAGQEQKQGTCWQLSCEGGDRELGVLGKPGLSPDWVPGERKQPPVRALSLLVMEESWVEAKAPQGDPPPVAAKGQSAQSPAPLSWEQWTWSLQHLPLLLGAGSPHRAPYESTAQPCWWEKPPDRP